MTLIDLAEYIDKKEEVYAAYEDQDAWNKKLFTTLLKQDSSHLTVQSNSMTKTSGTQNNILVA